MDVRFRLRVLGDRRLHGGDLCLSTYHARRSLVYFAAAQTFLIADDIAQDSVDITDGKRNVDSNLGLQQDRGQLGARHAGYVCP